MNKLKISILLMLYDAGEKGLTDKQIADRLDINKKKEVVDDLVASAVRLVSNRVGNHTL